MSCHICSYWTPEFGCRHYFPDSETILLKAGFKISKPGTDTTHKKFILTKDKVKHRFESLARAADVLIHSQATNND